MQAILEFLQTFVIGFLGIVVAFGLAVFIHELGHFLAAKAFGVPVERFVIGFDREAMPYMPKCIWEKHWRGTTYGVSLMPLGGYVKMKGIVHPELEKYLEGEEAPKEGEQQSAEAAPALPEGVREDTLTGQAMGDQAALWRKPYWQKVIIYSAGVIMNLVLAMGVVAVGDVIGREVDAPLPSVVSWQSPDSPLLEAGIQSGDEIVAVSTTVRRGGEVLRESTGRVSTDEELFTVLFTGLNEFLGEDEPIEQEIDLTLARDGETFEANGLLVRWTPGGNTPEADMAMQRAIQGIVSPPAYVEYVIPDRPADKAGLEIGDFIRTINGEPIDDFNELVYIVSGALGEELEIEVERAGEMLAFTMEPMESTDHDGEGVIGVFRGNPDKIVIDKSVGQAVVDAPEAVISMTHRYVQQLGKIGGRLVRGEIRKVKEDLGGPVAIGRLAARHANLGLDRYLQFLILFNIALAVINILPIPILDGGHIVLATFEAIFRRPVPPKVLVPVLNGAMIFLLCFVVLVTFSDLFKWLIR